MLSDGSWFVILYVFDAVFTAEAENNVKCPVGCVCKSLHEVNCAGVNITDAYFQHISLQVEELNLSNNNLRSIPRQLVQYTRIVYLNLSSNRIAFVSRNTFNHMSRMRTLDLSHNLINSLSDMEAGVLFSGNTKLETLNLSGNAINDLGDGYDQILYSESLTRLDASRCSISQVQGPIVLQGMPKLAVLNLSKNTITRIDGLASESLQSLDLSECDLKHLRFDTFEKLPKLKEVKVAGNRQLTDPRPKPASASVAYVDLSYCALHTNYASELVESRTVILRGNLLVRVASRAFENNSKLERLDLSDNRIAHVDQFAFGGAESLRWLDLSANRLTTLEATTFSPTPSLTDLLASKNLFETIPPLNASTLLSLDLSGCAIDDVRPDALSLLPSLRTLNVSHNRLLRLSASALQSSALRLLDVSYCRLMSVDEFALAKLTALEEINLTGNRLVQLKPKTLADGRLERVSLAENPWICDCLDRDLRELWTYLSTEPCRLKLGGTPRCHYPENTTDRLWHEACHAQWYGEPRKSKDVIVLVIIVTVLLVSGIVACVVAIKESWKIRQNRNRRTVSAEADGESERDRLNETDDVDGPRMAPRPEDAAIGESVRKFTQLPSYDEALLLPKPPTSSATAAAAAADETSCPSSNVRQTVVRLEMSKKRQSGTQTEENIDALLAEMALRDEDETPAPVRRASVQELQYINVKPLPVQCTEL